MKELISVIVPVYNVEKYIGKCIDSIIAQTYDNLEIIIVDDGSADSCPQICDEYAVKDSRIKVIHKANGGLSDARNAGIDASCGDYIGFVDSDDCIEPDMYEKLYNALVSGNADMAVSNFTYVDDGYNPIEERNALMPVKDEVISAKEALGRTLKEKGWYYVTAWNKLYKRALFDEVRFPVGRIHEDEFIVHRIYGSADRVACVSDSCYLYVQRSGSIMKTKYSIKNLDGIKALEERFDYCMDNQMDDYAAELTQRIYGMLLDADIKLDMHDEDNKRKYSELKKKYISQCHRVRDRLTKIQWMLDVVIFGKIPAINRLAAVRTER